MSHLKVKGTVFGRSVAKGPRSYFEKLKYVLKGGVLGGGGDGAVEKRDCLFD